MDPKALGNQPAVPFAAVEEEVTVKNQFPGLTKREEIAKAAMAANRIALGSQSASALVARAALNDADALLAALAKEGQS